MNSTPGGRVNDNGRAPILGFNVLGTLMLREFITYKDRDDSGYVRMRKRSDGSIVVSKGHKRKVSISNSNCGRISATFLVGLGWVVGDRFGVRNIVVKGEPALLIFKVYK